MPVRVSRIPVALSFLVWGACVAPETEPLLTAAEPAAITFEQHVRPILKTHCFHCHGEEDEVQGNLDVRLVRLLVAGGDSGPALVKGKAAESLLLQRIEQGEMPPGGKKLADAELAILRTWIDGGANTARPEPAELSAITDEERAFWSFQPIARPALPVVDALTNSHDQVNSPIDPFLLARLRKAGLGFSPAADKRTLIRRAYFTLIGLPPTLDEIEAFASDSAPDAWDRLLDRLLASPHYGERWGRHWLDVAGYADSDGYSEKDLERKFAFKYRDYVIHSLNTDKPWNQMLVEQLAGDELLKPPYANLSPEQAEQLIATGFLRMGPDGTGDGSIDPAVARNEVMADTLKIVSTSLLGISVGCAQCHDHRYDPVPQTDYYRFRAIFEPAYDVKNWRAPGARNLSLWTDETRQQAKEIDAAIAKLNKERAAEVEQLVAVTLEKKLAELPDDIRELARAARATPVKERTAEQKELLAKHPNLNVTTGNLTQFDKAGLDAINKKYGDQTAELTKQRPEEDNAAVLTEVPGKVPATFVFYRGDINSPRGEVQPGELTVLAPSSDSSKHQVPTDDPALPTTGRRLAYARWLTSGEHPLVARVLVNRFWHHHFGRGIVATPADFGQLGARPSHPELLDWLASRFVDDGWQLKKLHRVLLSSTAFQQASARRDEHDAIDPDNLLLARMSLRRLEAETVRDALLFTTGRLTIKLHGKPVPVMPDEVGQVVVGVDTRDGAGRPTGKVVPLGEEEFRRSVYVQVRRSLPLSMLETFDAPLLTPNCDVRNQSTAAPQSLLLMNNQLVTDQSTHLAQAIVAEAKDDLSAQATAAWVAILAETPNSEQLTQARDFLVEQTKELAAVKPPAGSKTKPLPAETRALANLCQALLGSNQFLYVD
jgi:mono/diheme cytochrome c family protein